MDLAGSRPGAEPMDRGMGNGAAEMADLLFRQPSKFQIRGFDQAPARVASAAPLNFVNKMVVIRQAKLIVAPVRMTAGRTG